MATKWTVKRRRAFVCGISIVFVLVIGIEVHAQEVLIAQMSTRQQIKLEVRESLKDTVDVPVIHLFEVVTIGDKQRIFERTPVSVTRSIVNGNLTATLDIAPVSANFHHFEVEVRNYVSNAEPTPQSFRGLVVGLNVTGNSNARNKEVNLNFLGPSNVDWGKFKEWISTTAKAAATGTAVLPDGSKTHFNVTEVNTGNLLPGGDTTNITVTFALDERLPIGSKVTMAFAAAAFHPNPSAGDLPVDMLRAGVGPITVGGTAVSTAAERDKVRVNVLEAGGNFNTSIKLDPDPTKNEEPKRKNEANADLRLASPSIFFADHKSRYAMWTPAQFDAQVSNDKLTGESISTNTMRLFTQVQQVWNSTGGSGTSFYRLVGEGGINADRDLRTIEYTGLADFRFNPGALNRPLDKNAAADRATVIRTEFIPIGVELGHRQVRRDPLFVADDFVRRLRFGAKLELIMPPYFEFGIEDRVWWRGEFAENKFKNYFTMSLTVLPVVSDTNSSVGVFISYERGALPPFTTQRVSTLKAGFRVRRKSWRSGE
jgi:hypothetical protein